MQFIEPEICNYTENIWNSILGLEARKVETPFKAEGLHSTLAGCVHIMGAWEGAVSLQCPTALARKAAAIMFSIKEDEADMEQIQDALGEITNMTGGNLKALLPEPCFLSLPAVALTDFALRIPGTEIVSVVNFMCNSHNFAVALLKHVKHVK